MHWYLDPITKHYADFSGRATRQEFWMFFLFSFGIGVVLNFIGSFAPAVKILAAILVLVTIIPWIALWCRRYHDLGKSGWWALIVAIPFIGVILMTIDFIKPSQVGASAYGPNKYEGEPIVAQDIAMASPASTEIPTAVPPFPVVEDEVVAPVVGYENFKSEDTQ